MADTQTLSDPFKLPKGNADTSGKIPGQKDYNKNSQTKNTYKNRLPLKKDYEKLRRRFWMGSRC